MQSLPIDLLLPQAMEELRRVACLVLVAPPGAGKTTRVPPALAHLTPGRVIVLEPRRVAARAAAARIAEERGWRLGEEVGYQVRLERCFSARTRILVVTEGILTRMLQDDPFLEGVGAVVFDEFHERSLHTDLALAMARRVQLDARPELLLVVMSATLDPGPISAYLGDCPVLRSEGRAYPVETAYLDAADDRPVHARAAAGVRRAWSRSEGGVLCFLPGSGEIRRTAEELAAWAPAPVQMLYGDLPLEQQNAVLRPGQARRIVLSTNVAETSVTVDGITAVVDTGLVRVLRQDPATGLDRLELGRVSRASADQRAGRAGRQAPGLCLRLWTAGEHRGLLEREAPEIRRVDLSGAALELLCWGERDLEAFGWFEAPERAGLLRALELLRGLGAVESGRVTELGRAMQRLPVQPRLARLLVEGWRLGVAADAALLAALLAERDPLTPLARWSSSSDVLDRVEALREFEAGKPGPWEVNRGAARHVLRLRDQLLTAARGASSPPPTEAARSASNPRVKGRSPLRGEGAEPLPAELEKPSAGLAKPSAGLAKPSTGLEKPSAGLEKPSAGLAKPSAGLAKPSTGLAKPSAGLAKPSAEAATLDRVAERQAPPAPGKGLAPSALPGIGRSAPEGGRRQLPLEEALSRALLAAFPDRLARRREAGSPRAVLVGGRGVRLAESSAVLEPELFVCVDLDAAKPAEAIVRLAAGVEAAWLPAELLTRAASLQFDPASERVVGHQRVLYQDLVLEEKALHSLEAHAAAQVLAEAASRDLPRVLPASEAFTEFRARVQCLAGWMPELGLPSLDDEDLRSMLPNLCQGLRSFDELRRAPWLQLVRARMVYRQLEALDREAPERLQVPSGSHVRVQYQPGSQPVLAVKLQEMFGLADTPRIAGGRVPLLLHLLAPNGRPQQVTQDLRSFWNTTYPEVRKELRGRYPKHGWPEDPWNAPPQRRPSRRS